jgi:FkbM family methyltransferase
MMIPLQEILNKYELKPKGVIVVGAHWAEEHNQFLDCGITNFVYVEPCRESFRKMVRTAFGFRFPEDVLPEWAYESGRTSLTNYEKFGVISTTTFNVACGEEEGDFPMYVSHQNQGQSNSLLKPELHTIQHPEVVFDDAEVVRVIPLDKLPFNRGDYDMLYMDVQGAEGLVLKGAEETLRNINFIMTECNRGQTYEGNMEIEEMDAFLGERGFVRVETYWPSPNWTWGDACYIRKSLLNA